MAESIIRSALRTRVKICGITNRADAQAAVAAGADAIGLVFYPPSPRAVNIEAACDILSELPPLVTKVGLFLDAAAEEVSEALAALPIDLLQFHGSETAAYCESFNKPYIKALGVADDPAVFDRVAAYSSARACLFDSHATGQAGGTGKSFDWSIFPGDMAAQIILAGGLNPDNVAAAISSIRPFAVDVSSGVEAAPGRKDYNLMQKFVAQVMRADSEHYVF